MKNKNIILPMAVIFSVITFMIPGCKKEEPKYQVSYGAVTDNDGTVYKTVLIGSQTWMAEDLKSGTFQNGEQIPNVSEQPLWKNLTSGAVCYYETYDEKSPFGKLYNWYAVTDSRNICPVGWHVPDNEDWKKLFLEVGPAGATKLKESSINYWAEWTYNNTNETGFTAKPNGCRTEYSISNTSGYSAGWWSSTSQDESYAWFIYLSINSGQILNRPEHKVWGIPVRCVKD
jgi:uncharacterized protein (TIGR02145 family)